MKLTWCLALPVNTCDEEAEAIVKQKIHRWEKDTLCRNVNVLDSFRNVLNKQEIDKAINGLKNKPLFSDSTVEGLPKFSDMVDQLPYIFKNVAYPFSYRVLNNAVHLDVTSLSEDYISKVNNVSKADSDFIIKQCLYHALHINATIRMNYKIDVSAIEQEHHNLMNKI